MFNVVVLVVNVFIIDNPATVVHKHATETETNKNQILYTYNRLKNPHWWKNDQLAICKHDQGVKPRNNSKIKVRAGLEPATSSTLTTCPNCHRVYL